MSRVCFRATIRCELKFFIGYQECDQVPVRTRKGLLSLVRVRKKLTNRVCYSMTHIHGFCPFFLSSLILNRTQMTRAIYIYIFSFLFFVLRYFANVSLHVIKIRYFFLSSCFLSNVSLVFSNRAHLYVVTVWKIKIDV